MRKNKLNIIVTSAGTASAISVIKSLKHQTDFNIRITAVDSDNLAAGLYLADQYYIVPRANESNYIETLISIGKKENATILLPIYSKEINIIAANRNLLETNNLRTLLPDSSTIDLCDNKKEMNKLIMEMGFKIPKTYTNEELKSLSENQYPLFVKPNTGSSSANTFVVNKKEEMLDEYETNEFIVQEYIKAEEVTVDIFCNNNHDAMVIAPRLRLATKSGQSIKGKTISDNPFSSIIKKICKELKIRGACNVQFFYRNGEAIFIEMNPRYAAGGLMLTVLAGANIPLLVIKEILNIPIEENECKVCPDMFMTRYWEEIIFENKK